MLKKLVNDTRGVAAVEFGIWVTVFFLAIMPVMDFATFYMMRGRANEAIAAAATKSFADRDNVEFGNLQSYVRNFSENQSLTLTSSCNGVANSCTNLNRTCACLKSNGTYTSASCGSSCSGSGVTAGSTAGYYLQLSASQIYSPVAIPHSVLDGADLTQAVTVRLQ